MPSVPSLTYRRSRRAAASVHSRMSASPSRKRRLASSRPIRRQTPSVEGISPPGCLSLKFAACFRLESSCLSVECVFVAGEGIDERLVPFEALVDSQHRAGERVEPLVHIGLQAFDHSHQLVHPVRQVAHFAFQFLYALPKAILVRCPCPSTPAAPETPFGFRSGTGSMVTTADRIRQVLPPEREVKESDCSRLREATL